MLLYFLFHTVSFPHFVENTVENRKTLEIPAFSRVEKCKAFSTKFFSFFYLSLKKKDFHIKKSSFSPAFSIHIPFPQIFSHFSLFHRMFFQENPQETPPEKFYTNRILFSARFPIRKQTPATIRKSRRHQRFSDFSHISTGTKTNTSKKYLCYFFFIAKRKRRCFSRVWKEHLCKFSHKSSILQTLLYIKERISSK